MLIPHGPNDGGSGRRCLGKRRIGIVYDHHHSDGPSGKRLRAEILMLGRLIGHPKLGPAGRQSGDYGSIGCIDTIDNFGTKGGFVELNCLRPSSDRKHRRYRSMRHGLIITLAAVHDP